MWYEDQLNDLEEMRREESLLKVMQPPEIPKPAPGLVQAEAAFELFNPITSWIVQEPLPNTPAVEGYNPMDDLEGYEQDYRAFTSSRSPKTTAVLKNRIDRQRNNEKIIQEGDWVSTASTIAASVGDPLNAALMLVPGSALMTKGKPLISMIKSAGAGLVVTAASEAALHATQETRRLEETAINFAATALFDGVLGSIAGALTKSERDVLIDQITEQITPLHAGAAQRQVASGEKMKEVTPFFKFTGLGYLGQVMAKVSPAGRLFQSKNQEVRATAQKMLETQFEVLGDELPTAVETFIKLDRARGEEAVIKVRNLQEESGLDSETFSLELTSAQRRGDIHENPQVQQAAQELRGVMDDMWNKAAELKIKGTFDEEGNALKTATAESYLSRRYDLGKVKSDPLGFQQAWKNAIIDAATREGRGIPENLDEIVLDVQNNVDKLFDGSIHAQASAPAMTKARVNVRDEFLEEYLIRDWEVLFDSYVNTMSSRIRLAEAFGEGEGDYMMTNYIESLKDKMKADISKAQDTGATRKVVDQIKKSAASDIHDIEAMRDTLLGQYRGMLDVKPENRGVITTLRTVRSLNTASMLNSVLISSMPDIARVITAHGARNYTKALARSIKTIKLNDLPKDQLAKIASAADRASSVRLQQMADIDDGLVLSKAEAAARWLSDKTLTFSGLKHLNALNKTIVGSLSGDKIASDIFAGGGTKMLKRLGVNSEAVEEQVKKYAVKDPDGLYTLNVDRWDNREAAEQIEAAVIKEADKIVLTPGVGDKPLLLHGEVAKTIFQYKNFILAATNRLMIPLMQEQGARKWVEIYSLMGLGAMSYYAGAFAAGRTPSDDPAVILKESIDRAGLAGYAMEMANITLKLAGDPFAGNTRYRSRDKIGAVLGPTAGTFNQLMKITDTQATADTRLHAMRRLAPLQNHFLLRRGIDQIEGEAAKALGGTGKYAKSKDRGKAVSF